MSAIQHCTEIKEYYQRKVGEGKNEMLVINNVCNKLVHRIFACVSRREKYNENYIQTFAWIIEIIPLFNISDSANNKLINCILGMIYKTLSKALSTLFWM